MITELAPKAPRVRNRVLTEKEVEVVQKFRSQNPAHEKDVRKMGLTLIHLGDGLYRNGYRINGTELVVKIPKNLDDSEHVDHGTQEAKMWNHLLRSELAAVVPPLRYHNEMGVILTDVITLQVDTDKETQGKIHDWKNEIPFPKNILVMDLHGHNIGVYNQRFVISDLGLFKLRYQ